MKNILLLFFVLASGITYVSYRNLNSSIEQKKLTIELRNNKFEMPIEVVRGFEYKFPNITVTTLPISGIIARYYFVNSKFEEAINILHEGKSSNPYSSFNEAFLGEIYLALRETDSAYHYSKIAFESLPNNPVHFGHYSKSLLLKKKYREIKSAFDRIKDKHGNTQNWELYLSLISQNLDSMSFEDPIALSKEARTRFPENKRIKMLTKYLTIGEDEIKRAAKLSDDALKNSDSGNFSKAAELYLEAFKIDNEEYSFLENAILSLYNAGDFKQSIKNLEILFNEFSPEDGKAEMIYGLNLVKLGEKELACEYFTKSIFKNYKEAFFAKSKFCKK